MDVAQYDVASTKSGKTAASIKALSLTLSSTSVVKHYMDVKRRLSECLTMQNTRSKKNEGK